MKIHPKLEPVLYGIIVFVSYSILVLAMRYFSHYKPLDAVILGLFSKNDILLGLLVAFVLTFTHERKKRLK